MKRIYIDHYDIDGNTINVVTCKNCGNQVRKEGLSLQWHDMNEECCDRPNYFYGISIPN